MPSDGSDGDKAKDMSDQVEAEQKDAAVVATVMIDTTDAASKKLKDEPVETNLIESIAQSDV